mgnify:CR=1 FL=1
MKLHLMGLSLLLASALLPRAAMAAAPDMPIPGSDSSLLDGNALDARQYRIENARVPGLTSARQSVTAWQVTSGSWDGQALDGLALVLVKTTDEGTPSGRQFNCYVSQFATAAQRSALIGAFLSAQPNVLSPRDAARMRIEPGVISIQYEDGAVVLHIGLVA